MHINRGFGVLFGASISVFLAAASFSSVNIALETIQSVFSANLSEIQWVVNAYFLTLASFIVTAGRLADRYGHQKMITIGISLFSLASLAGGFSTDIWMMVICRGLQGISAALIWPAGVAIAYHSLGKRRKGLAIGIVMGIAGMAYGIGPIIGGAMIQYFSWQWIYFYNVPLGILALIYALLKMENLPDPVSSRIDFVGLFALMLGLFGLFISLDNANDWGWSSLIFLLLILASLVMLAMFFIIELHVKEPIFDTHLLEKFSFLGVLLARGLLLFSWMSILFIMPIYFQKYHGLSPMAAGLYFLALVAGVGIIQPLGGKIVDKLNVRIPTVLGFIFSILAFVMLLLVHSGNNLILIFLALLIFGFGYGLVSSGLSIALVKALPKDRVGLASGIYYMVSVVGGAVGIAVTGFFLGLGGEHYLVEHLKAKGIELTETQHTDLSGILMGTQKSKLVLQHVSAGTDDQILFWIKTTFSSMFGELLIVCLLVNCIALLLALLSFYARKQEKRRRHVLA